MQQLLSFLLHGMYFQLVCHYELVAQMEWNMEQSGFAVAFKLSSSKHHFFHTVHGGNKRRKTWFLS